MLPRLRSFLKRSKSSSAASQVASNSTIEPEPVPLPVPAPNLPTTTTTTHTASTPAITSQLVSGDHSKPPETSQHQLLPSLLPLEPINPPTHRGNSTANDPTAKDNPETRASSRSNSPFTQQRLVLPSHECISIEKQVYVREDELSKASSDQLPWLSPSSNLRLEDHSSPALSASAHTQPSTPSLLLDNGPEIMQRKIWVRRPGASATLVTVNDDDLVDTVRDMILHKYANSLGKSIDSPDITLKIVSREQANQNIPVERTLGPEEPIGRTLDLYYAGGQNIEEALIIDIPQKRTPRPSPRVGNHHHPLAYPYFVDEQHRPAEGAREYFPPMAVHSPHLGQHPGGPNGPHIPHSMSILAGNQIPPLPSPGGHSTRRRPKYVRQHTSSPTIMHSHQPNSNDLKQPASNPPAPLPTPPVQSDHRPSIAQPNRPNSPHGGRPKRKNKGQASQQGAKTMNGDPQGPAKPMAGLLDGNVPPINVLIVEDNVINLRLLEQFMRKLKVRWKTAMNGREAVDTWRTGGFHLVLMDIQLPVMSGLEATKEIRRLESVNGIGLGLVGSQNPRGKRNGDVEISPADKLDDMDLFKSPVIIVALTASSLQSDRHEALAVGCNDFLTKPVGYPWMLRKVTEWGCMQALIDFDGWRKWKAYAEKEEQSLTPEQKKAKEKEERMKRKAELTKMMARPPPTTSNSSSTEKSKDTKTESEPKSPVNGTSSGSRTQRRGGSGGGTILETHEEEAEE